MNIKVISKYFFFFLLIGCGKYLPISNQSATIRTQKKISEQVSKTWECLNIVDDSLFGTAIYKASKSLLNNKKSKKTIIAVLDTEIDINHESIKPYLWTNPKEIQNNGIDDDKNGYIDDIHGWNFLGNKNGETILRNSYECYRILNYMNSNPPKNYRDSLILKEALKIKTEDVEKLISADKKKIDSYKSVFPNCYSSIKKYFPNGKYSLKEIDSLNNLFKNNNETIGKEIDFLAKLKKLDLDSIWVANKIKSYELDLKTVYNPIYQEKSITGDNPYDLKDSIYGNNNLSQNAKLAWHNTQVTGIITKSLSQFKNIEISVMPVVMVAIKGEENDKDVVTAIHYAINNGAKVINMSFGKEISYNEKWVREALIYAQKHDVLVVSSAGNSKMNIDNKTMHPIDYQDNIENEFCNNLIKVGGISNKLNKDFLYINTNYGKKVVDVFAPGEGLYVPDVVKGYTFSRGTSLSAAITSGVAALVRSYYPKLTAAQVKQILLDSSVKYDLQVQVPGEKEGTLKPFSELSKSGGVVNAYNALLMAEEMSKKK